MGSARGWHFPRAPKGPDCSRAPAHSGLRRGPLPAALFHTMPGKWDKAREFYKSIRWLTVFNGYPHDLFSAITVLGCSAL